MQRPKKSVAAIAALSRAVAGQDKWDTDELSFERGRPLQVAGQAWELSVSLDWQSGDLCAWVRVGRNFLSEARRERGRGGLSFMKPEEQTILESWDKFLCKAGYERIGDSVSEHGTISYCKDLRPADVTRERRWLDRVIDKGRPDGC